MSNIREKISEILEYRIPRDGWESAVNVLEKTGRITQRHLMEILIVACKRIEVLENEIYGLKLAYGGEDKKNTPLQSATTPISVPVEKQPESGSNA
jgi:hypothetical protein